MGCFLCWKAVLVYRRYNLKSPLTVITQIPIKEVKS